MYKIIKSHPTDIQYIFYSLIINCLCLKIQAEAELLKASADMSRTVKELEEQTDSFEKQKLQNMSAILKNFIEIELAFHTKALELYTVAYRQINNIDNEADLYVSNS